MPQYLPPVKYLHKILRCDVRAGKLYWRERTPDMFSSGNSDGSLGACKRWNARYANKRTFTTMSNGFFSGAIDGVPFLAHRVLFAMHHRRWPVHVVEHINGNLLDNRLRNLRETERPVPKPAPLGVQWDEERQQWAARVKIGRRVVLVGWYPCFEEAVAVTEDPDVRRKLRFNA
jgi:hypothetical protein